MTKNERNKLKYPNTDTFEYYNANPKKRITGDCVLRAISTGLNQTYEDTIKEMSELAIKNSYDPTGNDCIEKYLKAKGCVKCNEPRNSNNKRITGEQFCKMISKDRVIIMYLGNRHIVCIKDGKVHDTWYSQKEFCHSYWIRK